MPKTTATAVISVGMGRVKPSAYFMLIAKITSKIAASAR